MYGENNGKDDIKEELKDKEDTEIIILFNENY